MSDSSFSVIVEVIKYLVPVVLGVLHLYDGAKQKEFRTVLRKYIVRRGNRLPLKSEDKVLEFLIKESLPKSRILGVAILFTNMGLVLSVGNIAQQALMAKDKSKKSSTVVGMMLGEKLKNSVRIQLVLLLALAINALLAYVNDVEMSLFAICVVVIGFAAIYVDHKLIEYRVRRGWYGKNEFESREIIRFILAHADKNDFNDQGGLKKVIPSPSLEDLSDLDHANVDGVRV
ncbi:hypothetical protein V6L78_01915 [Pseudomonas canadensis]|uniref:hypothetical protein n=1 Tax=Pseudomonas canadensis TaxID=915099 RepID=UPI0030D159E5